MLKNKYVIVILGLLVSLAFLYLAFRNLRPEEFWNNLQQVQLGWLGLGALVYFIAVALISLRWQFLLRCIEFIPLPSLFSVVAIGYMGNNVYPLRAGEALRIALLKIDYHLEVPKVMTIVVLERVFDGLVMLTFVAIGLAFVEIESQEIRTIVTFATPLFLTLITVFFILSFFPNILRQLTAWVIRFLPKKLGRLVFRINEEIIQALEVLHNPAYLLGAVFTSYISWMVEASVYWLVSFAFGLDVSYPVILLVVGTVNLAGLIPASPGQVGVYEFFVSQVLIAVGISEPIALAYAVVVHLTIWLPITLVGLFFLMRRGFGWSTISHASDLKTKTVAG